VKLKLYSNIIR